MAKKDNSSFEQKLFKAADKLRKNIDAAEYKHVVLGLVFLKYISESFTELYKQLEADEWSDPEDRDEYIAENVFFVPKLARWEHIHAQAKLPTIGQTIDEAMELIEKENKELKNVLPQVYGKANLDKTSLGELIDLIWNTEGSFLKDAHPDLKADFVLANPPFNQKDWGADILQEDARWKYGTPPNGNANFAWMQHMLYHLSPRGVMATVLSNGSLSSNTSGEGEIRKNLVEADLVECIVALPKQLFYNTGIPACIWFLRREKNSRNNEILFIDASDMGFMKDRIHKDLASEDIDKIANTYHNWRKGENYNDEKGFCKSATLEEIRKHSHVLTPGRYVGIPNEEDDGIPFEDKMADLTAKLKEQMDKEAELNQEIENQLSKIGFSL